MSQNLVELYPEKFNTDFEHNKKVLVELDLVDDKPVRNKMAGLIASLVAEKNN